MKVIGEKKRKEKSRQNERNREKKVRLLI